MRLLRLMALIVGLPLVAAGLAMAQEPSTINFKLSGSGNWNTPGSWDLNDVPGFDGFSSEIAGISSGGEAVLTAPAANLIRGVVMGETGNFPPETPAETGALSIHAGGSLEATDAIRV